MNCSEKVFLGTAVLHWEKELTEAYEREAAVKRDHKEIPYHNNHAEQMIRPNGKINDDDYFVDNQREIWYNSAYEVI